MKIKFYAVMYNKAGRKDVGLSLKESQAIYLLDKPCNGYEHNLKVKTKDFPKGRWVNPLAVFAELREAKAYIEQIMFGKTWKHFYILTLEANLTGF